MVVVTVTVSQGINWLALAGLGVSFFGTLAMIAPILYGVMSRFVHLRALYHISRTKKWIKAVDRRLLEPRFLAMGSSEDAAIRVGALLLAVGFLLQLIAQF